MATIDETKGQETELNVKMIEAAALQALEDDLRNVYEKALKITDENALITIEHTSNTKCSCYVQKDGCKVFLGDIKIVEGITTDLESLTIAEIRKKIVEVKNKKLIPFNEIFDSVSKEIPDFINENSSNWEKQLSQIPILAENTLRKIERYTSTLQETFKEIENGNPIPFYAFKELRNLKKHEPEYKDIDGSSLTLEYEDEAKTKLADTLQNRAIQKAYKNAEENFDNAINEKLEQALSKLDKQELQELIDKQDMLGILHKLREQVNLEKQTNQNNYKDLLNFDLPENQSRIDNQLTKVMNEGGIIGKGKKDIQVKKGNKENIRFEAIVPDNYKGLENLTYLELEVIKGLCTLYQNNIMKFTISQLNRAITGKKENTISQQRKKKLEEIIEKFSVMKIKINSTEEARFYAKDPSKLDDVTIDRYLFQIESIYVSSGSKEAKMFYFSGKEAPPLYAHALLYNQLYSLPYDIIQIKDRNGVLLPDTDYNIATKGYLLDRLRQMKIPNKEEVKKNQNNKISFETLYEKVLGEPTKDRKKKQRIRDFAFTCLEYWKEKELIKDFKLIKESKGEISGIRIFF